MSIITYVMLVIVWLCLFHGYCHGKLAEVAITIAIGATISVVCLGTVDLIRHWRK